jgi:phosphonate transport system substrate-binding protein
MKRMKVKMLVMVVLMIMAAWLVQASIASAEIKFGILPRLSAQEMHKMFDPLAEYLTKETGEKVTIVVTKDFATYKDALQTGQFDLGFSNPIIYVQLKQRTALVPLALSAEKKAGTRFRGLIIARKDSGIEKVQDLKGKKLIFVDEDSAAGYIFQMLLLSKAGMDVNKDFTRLPFAKKHDNVTMAVYNKAADAGGIREDDLDKMKDKVDLSAIRIVAYTDYFPNWPVYATPKLNKNIADKIRVALIKLKPNDAGSDAVVGAANLAGFAAVSDKDYDLLRQAAKLVGAL